MKKKQILVIAIAVLVGLLGGYILFNSRDMANQEHQHRETSAEDQLWTCSMHPQILRSEPGNCPICGMELIPVERGALAVGAGQFTMTKNAIALANIQTMVVGTENPIDGGLLLSGEIRENEESNSVQASYFDGRIENLFINTTGETVERGKRLATIYSPQLVAAQQELLSAGTLKASQPALYEAVKNKLKLWKLSDNQIQSIEDSGKILENFPIFATVSGTVTEKMVQEGDYVKQGQPLLKISNLKTVWAILDAYENQLPALRRGMEVILTSNAYPNDKLRGTIAFIDPVMDTRSRTVEVRVVLQNNMDRLKPGMFVKGQVATGEIPSGNTSILIPSSAILWTGERSLVYVRPNPSEPVFEMREITVGDTQSNEWVPIVQGLEIGEEVVVNGTFTVDAAAQLKGKTSMMNLNRSIAVAGHEGAGDTLDEKADAGKLPENFKTGYVRAMKYYFLMKDALVADNPEQAKKNATPARDAFKILQREASDQKEQEYLPGIVKALSDIAGSNNLKDQRKHFIELNESLVGLSKGLEGIDRPIYVQFCPMANQNKGAYWLSREKAISNPYYGRAMVSCGSVTDSIK